MGSVKIWRPSYSISLQLIMKYIMIFQAFQSQWLIASSWLSSPQFHYQSWSSNLHLWWIFLIGMNCFVIISLFNKTGLKFKLWKPFISEKMRSICNHTTFSKTDKDLKIFLETIIQRLHLVYESNSGIARVSYGYGRIS